jgi:hypothetical protein
MTKIKRSLWPVTAAVSSSANFRIKLNICPVLTFQTAAAQQFGSYSVACSVNYITLHSGILQCWGKKENNFADPTRGLASLRCSTASLKRDGTCAETRFGLSAQRTNPFKSAGVSVQSTAGSRSVRISDSNGSNAGYTVS